MFVFFVSFAFSVFLPYSVTNAIQIDTYNDKQIAGLIKNVPIIACLAIPQNHPNSDDAQYIFSKLPTIYSDDIEFSVITSLSAPRIYKSLKIQNNPTIVFFKNGHFQYSIPFPRDEIELMTSMQYFLSPETKPISEKAKLINALGDLPFSILAIPDLQDNAAKVVRGLSEIYGSISVLPVMPSLLKELGYSGQKLCIYRQSDKAIEEVSNNLEDFLEKIKPSYFNKLTSEMIQTIGVDIGLLVVDSTATAEQKSILVKVSEIYPKATLGITNKRQTKVVNLIARPTPPVPYFIVINTNEYSYYQPVTDITEENIIKYLKDIENKVITKSYPSEPIPSESEGPLHKIVGLTYENFINQKDKDVLMFYTNGNPNSLLLAQNISEILKDTEVEVGIIDYYNNSSPSSFPVIFSEPHIQIYPARKKFLNKTYYGSRTLFTIIDFVRQNAYADVPLDMSLLDTNEEVNALIELYNELGDYSPEVRDEVMRYITDTGKKLGLGKTFEQIVQTLYRSQGGY